MGEAKWDAARRCFEDAVDFYFQSGAPFEVGRARIELARALERVGRIDAAVEEAHQAKTLLSELKAELEAGRAQSVLDGLAALQSTARPAVSKVKSNELTQREIEILRLVAEGLNNQTIAERLFVSDHTVHRHLANILNKLGVATRAAAVAQAARRGLLR
jgi:DNA-binding NarL/FixJ family response regulator